jgi:hypothetical protein
MGDKERPLSMKLLICALNWRLAPRLNVRPHPCPMASQARHESVAQQETCAPRNVVPRGEGEPFVRLGDIREAPRGSWVQRGVAAGVAEATVAPSNTVSEKFSL